MFEIRPTPVEIPATELVYLDTKVMSVSEIEAKIMKKSLFGRPFWKMAAIESQSYRYVFEMTSIEILATELVCLDTKVMSVSEIETKIFKKSLFGRPFWKMAAIKARVIRTCLK